MRQLKKRAQFLNAARGQRLSGRYFALQAVRVKHSEPGVGYTVTKRVGNSPERNRIKRRLRAAVLACQSQLRAQHEYVLIGRRAALQAPFCVLVQKLAQAITRLHARKIQRVQ